MVYNIRGTTSLVGLTLQQGNEVRDISCQSWPLEDQRVFLRQLLDRMLIHKGDHQTRNGRSNGTEVNSGEGKGKPVEQDLPNEESETEVEEFGPPTAKRRKTGSYHSSPSISHSLPLSMYDLPLPSMHHSSPSTGGDIGSGNKVNLLIKDEEAVLMHFERILTDARQNICRKAAKWWIHAINPCKQTRHPYSGGSQTRPWWWPPAPPTSSPGGRGRRHAVKGFVRHIEPDHLTRPERVTLLVHILNQVADPRKSQHLNFIDVTKLEQITLDSISNEIRWKRSDNCERRFFEELFRVARQLERYKGGEIDEGSSIVVCSSYGHLRKQDWSPKSDGSHGGIVGHCPRPPSPHMGSSPDNLLGQDADLQNCIPRPKVTTDQNTAKVHPLDPQYHSSMLHSDPPVLSNASPGPSLPLLMPAMPAGPVEYLLHPPQFPSTYIENHLTSQPIGEDSLLSRPENLLLLPSLRSEFTFEHHHYVTQEPYPHVKREHHPLVKQEYPYMSGTFDINEINEMENKGPYGSTGSRG